MHPFKFCTMVLLSILPLSCKSASPSDKSKVNDIGVIDSRDASTVILYQEQDLIYLKYCKPPVTLPIDRKCVSDKTPESMPLELYFSKLKLDFGSVNPDKQGLAFIEKEISDAK